MYIMINKIIYSNNFMILNIVNNNFKYIDPPKQTCAILVYVQNYMPKLKL